MSASFVIEGEQQLTVGVAGMRLAVIGGDVGALVAGRPSRCDRTSL